MNSAKEELTHLCKGPRHEVKDRWCGDEITLERDVKVLRVECWKGREPLALPTSPTMQKIKHYGFSLGF